MFELLKSVESLFKPQLNANYGLPSHKAKKPVKAPVFDTRQKERVTVEGETAWEYVNPTPGASTTIDMNQVNTDRSPELTMKDYEAFVARFGADTYSREGRTDNELRDRFGPLFSLVGADQFTVPRYDYTKALIIKAMWAKGKSAKVIAKEKKTAKGYSERTVAEYVAVFNASI